MTLTSSACFFITGLFCMILSVFAGIAESSCKKEIDKPKSFITKAYSLMSDEGTIHRVDVIDSDIQVPHGFRLKLVRDKEEEACSQKGCCYWDHKGKLVKRCLE